MPGGVLLATMSLWPAELRLWAMIAGSALALAPLWSWIGLLPGLPAAWLLLRCGWFDWVSAGAVGVFAGAIAAGMLDGTGTALPVGVGVLSAVLLRFALLRTGG